MGKSSIHLQTAKAGTILHNSRENYSKSVVFLDETNEIWNDSKTAFKMFRDELEIRAKAYTQRTKQKLQKNTSTMISAVINLEKHHTLKDLEDLKKYIEKEFDTKIIQMAIHRDEGKLINKNNPLNKLVSGKDFFLNTKDSELYFDSKFTQKINMDEWEIEKNYHAHFEMLGIDSNGNSLRKKMNMYKLSQLQDFTAEALNMERGNNNVEVVKENGVEKVKRKTTKNKKRLDTNEYKEQAKIINDFNMASDREKRKIIKQANETIKKQNEDKKKLKEELDFVKNEFKSIREMLKGTGATREDFKKIDELNKQLQNDLKNNDIDLAKATEEIKNLVIDLKIENKIKDEKIKELTNLAYSDVLYSNTNDRVPYKKLNEDKKKKIKEKDELILKLNEKIIHYDSQIVYIENLQKQIDDLLFEMETKVSQNFDEENNILKKENEVLKNENESLKKENSFLKQVIDKVLIYANYKIKELINYGKPQFKKSVSFEDFAKEVEKENNHKNNSSGVEMLNKKLEDLDRSNTLQR